ncbi:MAG: hypothetical protein C0402_07535 [Thermodesulfovibrio sp.]|nr:hypothetical protein [Thermodesulfovibrio sp.]
MVNGFMLKFMGELFYLVVALSAFYGLWNIFRTYKETNSTVIKAHITAYELQKMLESRPR